MTTTEQDYYQQYIAAGMPEDTAEILAGESARGGLVPAVSDQLYTDEQIADVVAATAARVCTRSGRHGCSLGAGHQGDCVLLCAVHPFRSVAATFDLFEAEELWVDIEPVEARYGGLCGPCFGRARHELHQTPQLLAHIRSQVTPSMESARGPRVSGSREAPIPIRADAVDDSHDLYAQVVNWIVSFARQTRIRPPATVIAFLKASSDPQRLPSWARDQASAFTLMEDMIAWYEKHELTIVTMLPPISVKAWCEDIGRIVGSFRSRYPQAERRPRAAKPRQCPTCGELTIVAVFLAAGVEVACTHCGEVIPEAEHDKYVDWAESIGTRTISLACDRGRHPQCGWAECPCDCHDHQAA